MRFFLTIFIIFLTLVTARTQYLEGASSKWDDDLTEWEIFLVNEESPGSMVLRWKYPLNWTEWDFRLGEITGSVETKWRNDASEWVVRSAGEVITVRMLWANDPREWIITDNSTRITFKTRYGNTPEEWYMVEDRFGKFNIFTAYQGDPRDWVVQDDTEDAVTLPMKMAMLFVAVFHNIPK